MSEEAIELLLDAGYDPVYGARPLKRALQRHLENPLAKALVSGTFSEGQTILVAVKEGALAFEAAKPVQA